MHCAGPENIHISHPQKGLEFPGGGGGRGEGSLRKNPFRGGGIDYFLELHIISRDTIHWHT